MGAQALAIATHKMVPQACQLMMKLELFGMNTCARWHQDHYVCRSIVSYNCSALDYTADSNVNFWELYNCGNNDCVIHDKSHIRSANVGDIVMIKGSKFPGKAKGLIHKSPEVRYHRMGVVQSRIVLKVDVEDPAGGEINSSDN